MRSAWHARCQLIIIPRSTKMQHPRGVWLFGHSVEETCPDNAVGSAVRYTPTCCRAALAMLTTLPQRHLARTASHTRSGSRRRLQPRFAKLNHHWIIKIQLAFDVSGTQTQETSRRAQFGCRPFVSGWLSWGVVESAVCQPRHRRNSHASGRRDWRWHWRWHWHSCCGRRWDWRWCWSECRSCRHACWVGK